MTLAAVEEWRRVYLRHTTRCKDGKTHTYWRPIADPKGQPPERVRAIRDQIRDRVRELIAAEGVGEANG